MAGHNRYLRGKQNTVKGTVKGNITVESGDFVVVNKLLGSCGLALATLNAADNYIYPLANVGTATAPTELSLIIATQFLGVAMTGSPSGTTNEVVVATSGIFRYPIVDYPSAVTIGSRVSAVSPAAGADAGPGVSNQWVANNATASANGTTAYLGTIVKTESGASFVDFEIWSGAVNGDYYTQING